MTSLLRVCCSLWLCVLLLSASADAQLFRRVADYASAGAGRVSPVAAVQGGRVVVLGGSNMAGVGYASAVQSANMGGAWSSAQSLSSSVTGARALTYPLPGQSVSSVVALNGKTASNTCPPSTFFSYNPTASTWSSVPNDMTVGRTLHGFVSATSASDDKQQLYVFGGLRCDTNTKLNDVYSLSVGVTGYTSTALPAPAWSARNSFGYTSVAASSRVMLTGGQCSYGVCTDSWVSNVGLTSWSQVSTPFAPRWDHSMVTINERIYVIGGQVASAGVASDFVSDVWVSPDVGQTWLQVRSVSEFSPRSSFGLAVSGSTVMVIGGKNNQEALVDAWVADLS